MAVGIIVFGSLGNSLIRVPSPPQTEQPQVPKSPLAITLLHWAPGITILYLNTAVEICPHDFALNFHGTITVIRPAGRRWQTPYEIECTLLFSCIPLYG